MVTDNTTTGEYFGKHKGGSIVSGHINYYCYRWYRCRYFIIRPISGPASRLMWKPQWWSKSFLSRTNVIFTNDIRILPRNITYYCFFIIIIIPESRFRLCIFGRVRACLFKIRVVPGDHSARHTVGDRITNGRVRGWW